MLPRQQKSKVWPPLKFARIQKIYSDQRKATLTLASTSEEHSEHIRELTSKLQKDLSIFTLK